MIISGEKHTIILDEKNEIYVCGYNEFGQLGLGDNRNMDRFEKVEYDFGKIKNIACSAHHTVIQNVKNEIYVCGNNIYGQLGLGDNEHRNIFEKVEFDFGKIKKIACGYCHIVIQNVKNEIYVCGYNGYGQLGLGDEEDRNIFEKVEYDLGGIKNIACGGNYMIIQNEKNEIYVCGDNEFGQLGFGDEEERNIFEKVEFDFGKIKNIACGTYHIVIQNEKNEVYVCGYNEFGQLGLGDNKDRNIFEKVDCDFGKIKNIVCGCFHTVIQNDKNEIYVCGRNYEGQLGFGDYKCRNRFEKMDHYFVEKEKIARSGLLYKISGMIYSLYSLYFGIEEYEEYERVEYEFGGIKNIACGGFHTVIKNKKNEIYVCGRNGCGQLGLGCDCGESQFQVVDIDL